MSATAELEIEFPIMRYDMMLPLLEGRVPIEGVRLRHAQVPSMIFDENSKLKEGDFGLCDLNMGFFVPAIEAGWEIVGLPVFSKRKPVYTYIFCRADVGIDGPKDLEGKRIGSGRYSSAITIWTRGLLKHHHKVDISKTTWVVSGHDQFPARDPEPKIEMAPDRQRNPVQGLLDGDFDAIITDISDGKLFDQLEDNPRVRRLFPDYMAQDERLYNETGIFTPVHMIVMSRKLDREHPELASRFYEAFERSKRVATDDILADQRGFGVVYLREHKREEMARWGDPWKHGITANKSTIDTFIAYNHEQGLIRRVPSYEEIFAAGALDT